MKFMSAFVILIVYLFLLKAVSATVERLGTSKSVNPYRTLYIKKTLSLCLTLLFVIFLLLSLGIEYAQISVFLSSVFAVIGIALFAQWSILSNVTASLIIFFHFPYRVGDKVKVLDDPNTFSGKIEEISLFHVILRDGEEVITYPNSVILQKAVVKVQTAEKLDISENKDD